VASFLQPATRTVHADPQHLYALLRTTLERQAELHRRVEQGERRHQRSLGLLSALEHELRTPLEGLRSWLEQRSDTDALAELGLRRADRLLARLDDLREMHGLETGAVALQPVPVGVGDVLLQAVEAARLQGHTVRSMPAPDGLAAQADPGRFLQALVGLMVYAGQHSDHGPVSVRAYPSGPAVAFEVRSRSEGAPVEDAQLARARQLIELQGGTFTWDTVPEKGTTFRFTLPQS
jgi:signal transduction histidine kinase